MTRSTNSLTLHLLLVMKRCCKQPDILLHLACLDLLEASPTGWHCRCFSIAYLSYMGAGKMNSLLPTSVRVGDIDMVYY